MELSIQNESKRKSLLQPINNSQHTQFAELQRSINQLLQQNRKKLLQISEARPNFEYQLYKVAQNKSQSLNFGRELLMRQLDRLMEQQNYLDRELSLISFQRQQSLCVKEELITTQINPFEVLRNVWTTKRQQHGSALQHVESLNEIVGSIKLSIKKLSQMQKDNHVQHTSDYLRRMLENEQRKVKCQKCEQIDESKKQLRETVENLAAQISDLNNRTKQLQKEVQSKDDLINKMIKKSMQNQTELKSKMMYLQEKLIMEERQVKLLSKFKIDLEKNVFNNQEEKYQIYFKTEEDLSGYCKNIRINLYQVLQVISNQEEANLSQLFRVEQQGGEIKVQTKQKITIEDLLLPELALPLSLSKDQYRKTSMTQRTRTDRKRQGFGQPGAQKIQDRQQFGKKYMRTNQLTTKRNKEFVYSPMESKNTASTLKLGDSPKSVQQQK